ncbi:MAG TPA: cation:proton antiporter [Hyphomicrobiaceae bacterium]|nr:cation:proton antiporter [Hyphomicrobiaceae bacterium]
MESHLTLLALGGLLLAGLAADEIGRRTKLPRVTLLILVGIICGPSAFDLLPSALSNQYEFLASIALTMVAFLLGGAITQAKLRNNGREILVISLSIVLLTALAVFAGLLAIGTPAPLALLLAGIATATDPAATQDVVRQTRAKGSFTETVLGIVAVDDAWGLIVFSVILVLASTMAGHGNSAAIVHGIWELIGAVLVGVAIGFPAAFLTGRIRSGEPMQSEALGLVLLCAGFSVWLGVSFLLAGMVTGAIVANFAEHHSRPFHEIEHIEWPFMVLFFVLSGASLLLNSLAHIGLLGVAYIILRILSRVFAGWFGAALTDAPDLHRHWIGLALMPQAGIALGMALVAGTHFPDYKETLLAVAIGTTVVFEVFGPFLTQLALRKVGEAE